MRVTLVFLALWLVHAPVALAADGEGTPLDLADAPADAAAQPGAGGGSLVRTIVGLAVVIGVIFGLNWVLKQVKRSREGTASGAGLSTLATLPLGPNRSLHLVRAGDEVVLLGSGEAGVTPIRTYREPEARSLGLLEEGVGVPSSPPPALPGAGGPEVKGGPLAALRRRTVIR